MDKILKRQIKSLEKQEEKVLAKPGNQLIRTKLTPITNCIEEKIPPKLKDTLDLAFYKGFLLVFEKGSKYIEKTYNKDKIQLHYDINNYAVDRKLCIKHLKNVDKQANRSNRLNSTISLAEGTILGLFGIGLPDIPLFIAVIIKTIYEVALSYGFNYESEEEKYYILLLICSAITKDDQQKEFNDQIKLLEEKINAEIITEINLEEQMKKTADVLSDTLLTAKFIQGLPFVGVFGGIVNHSLLKKISKFASMKYKKRFLMKKARKMN